MRKHEPAATRARRKSKAQRGAGQGLARAVALAGSPAALATLLGVRSETVRRWVREGITPKGTAKLAELRERLKYAEQEEQGKRQTFDLLLKLAGERSIEHQRQALNEGKPYKWRAGDKPKGRAREGTRAGPRTSGYQWVKAIEKMLTESLIVEIAMWITGRRKRFQFWQASMVISEYSKRKFMNSGSNSLEAKNLLLQVPNVPESGDFLANEIVATKRSASLAEVRDTLVAKLEEAIEEGSLVYIHEVTVFNYRLRTEPERLAWEAGKRSLRKKRAKRRAKAKKSTARKSGAPRKTKVWPNPNPKKKTSKKSSKRSKALRTQATRQVTRPTKKPAVSRSKSASTRSRRTGSSWPPASAKKSARKTSVSRSAVTTSKKSTKKPKSSLQRPTSRKPATSKGRTTAKKTTKKTMRATTVKKTKKTTKRAKR